MCWALIWLGVVGSSFLFSLWNFVFFVKHAPLKDASVVMTVRVNRSVLKVLVVNSVDDRDRHDCAVAIDWSEKWRQPVLVDFAMCVQVNDHFTCGFLCASKTFEMSNSFNVRIVSSSPGARSDQSLALYITNDPDLALEPFDVIIQLFFQVFLVGIVVDENDLV